MAARLARLPRLTLFSGPNCSLCDIAKAELAKVRQTVRPFQSATFWQSDSHPILPATIRVGNDQHPGPRAGEVEEEIRLLDSSTSSGGEGDRKGPVGRTDDHPSSGQLAEAEREREPGQQAFVGIGNIEPDPFFIDTGIYANWQPDGIYVRASETILGDEEQDLAVVDVYFPTAASPACFNCGEPTHLVSACPQPINRQLVSLSRDLHAFLKAGRGAVEYKRIHEVEEWRQQRLEFLDVFVPGEIRSPELRDALDGQDGDWLENMALWGYPKGWVSPEDPRDKVREIIWNEHTDEDDEMLEDFLIFGDDDIVERVKSHRDSETLNDDDRSDLETEDEEDKQQSAERLGTTSSTSTTLSSASPPPQPQLIRWATYPPSQFSSQLLPVYNGFMLPPISHQGSSTYTAERHALWQKIISGKFSPPPPPDTEPPPLPPPPPSEPPPPLPRPPFPSVIPSKNSLTLVHVNDPDDDDMDISDSD